MPAKTGTSGINAEQDTFFTGIFRDKQLKLGFGMILQRWQIKHCGEILL